MATLEERLQRLEDIEAIRDLKIRYAQYCDEMYNPEKIGPLFVEDAVWEGAGFGPFVGRQAIKDFFAGVSSAFTFALHYTLGHQIDVDPSGKTAKGTWYIFMPATINGGAVFMGAQYADDYVKRDGRWFFKHVRVQSHFMTPYEKGWVKQQFLQ